MKLFLGKLLVLTLLIGTIFYWYGLRPSLIRHKCSWVKRHENAIPARPAMSFEQLKSSGLIKDCTNLPFETKRSITEELLGDTKESCERNNQKIINDYTEAKPEVPAKDSWRKVTPDEYKFCLHDNGL